MLGRLKAAIAKKQKLAALLVPKTTMIKIKN
jgi:hypothetical protein